MTAFQTKLSYTTSKVKSDSNEGSKSNPLRTGKSTSPKPASTMPCDNNSGGYSDGEKSGLLGGGHSNGDHSGFLGGSNPGNNSPKGGDHSGFLGGSNPGNNSPKGGDHSGFLGGSNPGNNSPKGGDHSGFLGGSNPGNNSPKGGDHSGFLGGSNPGNNSPKGGDHSGFLGGSNPGNNSPKGGDHSGFLGGSNPGNNSPKGGDHSGFLGGSNPGNPTPTPAQPVVIQGTACNDTLRGNSSGRDRLVGTTEVARGVGERDVLIGGKASDTFVLGDTRGSFYVGKGNADYAEIQNFNRCNDGIQLAGSAQDYTISYANGISSIYSKANCSDLIATVDSGCSALDLSAKYFQFVPPACGGSM
jgi:hypothetical protein